MIANAVNFIRRLWSTYVWSISLSPTRPAKIASETRLTWWSYALATSLYTVAVTIGGTIAAFRINPLAIYSPKAYDIAGVISDLNDTGRMVWNQFETLSLGDAGIIFCISLCICVIGIRSIARLLRGRKKLTVLEVQLAFVLSSTLIKFSSCWLALSLITMACRPFFELAFRRNENTIYAMFIIVVIALTLLAAYIERAQILKLHKSHFRPVVAGVMWAVTVVSLEMTFANAVAVHDKPSIAIVVSPKCDRDACLSFVSSKNIANQFIAAPLRFQVELVSLDSSTPKTMRGYADIEFSSVSSGAAALAIGAATEQVVYVRSVQLVCPLSPELLKSYAVSEAIGNNLLHVSQAHDPDSVAMAEFRIDGRRTSLFRLANPTCIRS